MENTHDNLNKITNEWVKEAGIEQPSVRFVQNVMEAVEAQALRHKVYQPLISPKGWGMIVVLVVVSLMLPYFLPLGELGFFEKLNLMELPSLKNPFEGVQFSKTMVYAIGFLALFLVQIPFLKRRYID